MLGFRVAPPKYSDKKPIQYLLLFFYWIGLPFFLFTNITFFVVVSLFWYIGNITLKSIIFSVYLGGIIFKWLVLILTNTSFVFKNIKLPRINFPKFKILKIEFPNFTFPNKLKLLLTFILFIGTICYGLWMIILKDLPTPGELSSRNQAVSTKILDRNGALLYKIYRNQNRSPVKLSELPDFLRLATVAIEDANFYTHPGFSIRGIIRSIWRNSTSGQLFGGSTITQQLVKNTLLSPEKTFTRKLKEIVLAIQVELTFSKDEILEMYFNEVGYGGTAYGIEEASLLYFDKHASELNLTESALLAGLPRAPTTYSPFGANPSLAKARQLEVLSRMVQDGYITQIDVDEATRNELVFAPQKSDIRAPHFVMYVKQLLAEKYGEQMVEEGGLEVVTSLDLELQNKVQETVSNEVNKLKNLNISNGASLVSNPKTGEIIAMVGSTDYYAAKFGNYNVTTAARQPGSSIKPINYAYALNSKLFTAASMLSDSPVTYDTAGTEAYTPRNYDNSFRGNVSVRTSLASSLNIPAVKVLASYGVNKMIEQAQKMGITTWNNPQNYGLSLTLGGGEVKMTDMAVAYGVFSNYGKRVNLQPILKITSHKGEILEQNYCDLAGEDKINLLAGIFNIFTLSRVFASEAKTESCHREVLSAETAFIITDILRDNNARKPVFGENSLLVIPNHKEVAVKTGTTQNLRDNWAIGYTQDFVVATWVGNNDNSPMSYVASGVTGATPIWHKIMRSLLDGQANHDWEIPKNLVNVSICPTTGTLPCEGCGGKMEYFIEGTEPKNRCVPKAPDDSLASPVPQIL